MAGRAHDLKLSYLDLIERCDNFRGRRQRRSGRYAADDHTSKEEPEVLVPFYLSPSLESPVIGLLRPLVVDQLRNENENENENDKIQTSENSNDLKNAWFLHLDGENRRVSFEEWVNTPARRTAVMKELCERWRDTELFGDVCGRSKWRNELYPIYANPFGVHDYPSAEDEDSNSKDKELNFAFEVERSACALFGLVTYGVHMTIYEDCVENGERSVKIWVPTRARTKQTWPGYLDNSVAGGIPSGTGVFESMVKESMEEASLAEHLVRQHARAAGAVSYYFQTSAGWLQPEVEYIYDLRVPQGVDATAFQPKPLDGEVESFELLFLSQVILKMQEGKFKANCAVVIIDFMIRHGFLTPENEPDYMEIMTRLHGRFDIDKW